MASGSLDERVELAKLFIVLWQTVYTQAALDHLAADGHKIDPADIARLSPLGHPTINLQGRYGPPAERRATGSDPSDRPGNRGYRAPTVVLSDHAHAGCAAQWSS